MAFGTGTAGVISRTTRSANQQADITDKDGKITSQTTYGASIEIQTETFADSATNSATSGLSGAGPVVIADEFVESNEAYARKTITTRTVNV
jgi:hypothetical protein